MAQSGTPATHPNDFAESPALGDWPEHWKTLWIPAILCAFLLVAEAFYIFYNLDLALQRDISREGKPIAVLTSLKKNVRQKPDGTLVWQAPASGQDLFQEDAIATMDGSEALVTFSDKSELLIEPNSLVILEEAPSGDDSTLGGKRIVARLVKGSIKRKSSGPSELFIRLSSSKDSKPIIVDQLVGNAVFRVIHRGHGLEVIVESGTVRVNRSHLMRKDDAVTVSEGKLKLPPPRLKKPTINIKAKEPSASWLDWLMLPSAYAADSREIEIQFNWDSVPNSEAYLIQISKDSDFSSLTLKRQVSGTDFIYRAPAPETATQFFFRVAAISWEGATGEFSEPQRVEIKPEPGQLVLEPTVIPPQKPKKAVPGAAKVPPKIVAVKKLPAEDRYLRTSHSQHFELGYGLVIHHRKFTSDTPPLTTQGFGIVPARVRGEWKRISANSSVLSAGASYLLESLKPDLPPPGNEAIAAPAINAWASYGWNLGKYLLSAGPSVFSSSHLYTEGLLIKSESKWIVGGVLRFSTHPDIRDPWHWRMEISAAGLGATGADINLSVRRPFNRLLEFHSYYASQYRGAFLNLEWQSRIFSIESSHGGAIEIGYSF